MDLPELENTFITPRERDTSNNASEGCDFTVNQEETLIVSGTLYKLDDDEIATDIFQSRIAPYKVNNYLSSQLKSLKSNLEEKYKKEDFDKIADLTDKLSNLRSENAKLLYEYDADSLYIETSNVLSEIIELRKCLLTPNIVDCIVELQHNLYQLKVNSEKLDSLECNSEMINDFQEKNKLLSEKVIELWGKIENKRYNDLLTKIRSKNEENNKKEEEMIIVNRCERIKLESQITVYHQCLYNKTISKTSSSNGKKMIIPELINTEINLDKIINKITKQIEIEKSKNWNRENIKELKHERDNLYSIVKVEWGKNKWNIIKSLLNDLTMEKLTYLKLKSQKKDYEIISMLNNENKYLNSCVNNNNICDSVNDLCSDVEKEILRSEKIENAEVESFI